mmetsp:Transcript_33910/g.133086  ORF Transcript_33910/g.133086 Transcript_33910/m.133086 type:complete len:139 (-) Transcript_33910:286-702(-)
MAWVLHKVMESTEGEHAFVDNIWDVVASYIPSTHGLSRRWKREEEGKRTGLQEKKKDALKAPQKKGRVAKNQIRVKKQLRRVQSRQSMWAVPAKPTPHRDLRNLEISDTYSKTKHRAEYPEGSQRYPPCRLHRSRPSS